MKILALDASTVAIGYCVLDVEEDTILHLGVHKPKGKALDIRMFNAYYWFKTWLGANRADILVIELPVISTSKYKKKSKMNPLTTIKLAQMVGVLRLAAYPFVDRIIPVLPQDRLTALGLPRNLKRDPAKEQVMGRVNARYGLDITLDDESDAIAVALAGVRELRKQKRKETK